MISRKFANLSNDQLATFISEPNADKESDDMLDAVTSVSDLWVLANMNETYNNDKDYDIKNIPYTDISPDMFSLFKE